MRERVAIVVFFDYLVIIGHPSGDGRYLVPVSQVVKWSQYQLIGINLGEVSPINLYAIQELSLKTYA